MSDDDDSSQTSMPAPTSAEKDVYAALARERDPLLHNAAVFMIGPETRHEESVATKIWRNLPQVRMQHAFYAPMIPLMDAFESCSVGVQGFTHEAGKKFKYSTDESVALRGMIIAAFKDPQFHAQAQEVALLSHYAKGMEQEQPRQAQLAQRRISGVVGAMYQHLADQGAPVSQQNIVALGTRR